MRPLPEEMWATDVADLYGIPRRTVRDWCSAPGFPARKIGKLWLIKIQLLRDRHSDLYEELAERWERRERRRSGGSPSPGE